MKEFIRTNEALAAEKRGLLMVELHDESDSTYLENLTADLEAAKSILTEWRGGIVEEGLKEIQMRFSGKLYLMVALGSMARLQSLAVTLVLLWIMFREEARLRKKWVGLQGMRKLRNVLKLKDSRVLESLLESNAWSKGSCCPGAVLRFWRSGQKSRSIRLFESPRMQYVCIGQVFEGGLFVHQKGPKQRAFTDTYLNVVNIKWNIPLTACRDDVSVTMHADFFH